MLTSKEQIATAERYPEPNEVLAAITPSALQTLGVSKYRFCLDWSPPTKTAARTNLTVMQSADLVDCRICQVSANRLQILFCNLDYSETTLSRRVLKHFATRISHRGLSNGHPMSCGLVNVASFIKAVLIERIFEAFPHCSCFR